MKASIISYLFPLLFIFTLVTCKKVELLKEAPSCIEHKIQNIRKEKVTNPPTEVWEWKVDGKTFFYITSGCCDQFNLLYDENCTQICAPDGGIKGEGDGKCPEFKGKIEQTLVWKDER